MFGTNYQPNAFYMYTEGVGYVGPNGWLVWDSKGKYLIHKDSSLSDDKVRIARAHLQMTFQDYLDK